MTDRKINILFLMPSFIVGGAEIQLLYLVRGLDKKRFNVHVATFYSSGDLKPQFEAIKDITVTSFNKKKPLDFWYLRKFVKFLRQHDIEIIQMYNTSAKAIGMLAAILYRVPVSIVTERSARELPTSRGSKIYSELERKLIRKATLTVANSIAGAKFLKNKGMKPEKIHVIHNGVDPERLKVTRSNLSICQEININPTDPVVGMVGTLKKQKDHRTLLTAAQIVLQKIANCKFVILGDGPYGQELQKVANEMGLKDSVVFAGPKSDVANYINIFSVFALTSSKTEGCSNAILEAMALRKPVIATRVGGNVELVEEERTGYLVDPKDAKALAEKITILLCDKKRSQKLGDLAHEKVQQHFTLKIMTNKYQNLYLSLSKNKWKSLAMA